MTVRGPHNAGVDPLTPSRAPALTAMPVLHAPEPRSPLFVRVCAVAGPASSACGFLAGTWPFGLVELVRSGGAVRRRWTGRAAP